MGVVDQGPARHTDHPVLVGYQVRWAWCVVPQATCQSPAQASNLAAQEDLLEVARGAVSLSGCAPFLPVAVPKTVAYSVLCPPALVEEARQFLQVPPAVSPRLAGACTCNAPRVLAGLVQEVSSAYSDLKLGRHAAAAGPAEHVFTYDAAGSADGADSGAGTPWASGIDSACRQLQYSLLQPCAQGRSRWEPAIEVVLPTKLWEQMGSRSALPHAGTRWTCLRWISQLST